jgi:hypothetical protein
MSETPAPTPSDTLTNYKLFIYNNYVKPEHKPEEEDLLTGDINLIKLALNSDEVKLEVINNPHPNKKDNKNYEAISKYTIQKVTNDPKNVMFTVTDVTDETDVTTNEPKEMKFEYYSPKQDFYLGENITLSSRNKGSIISFQHKDANLELENLHHHSIGLSLSKQEAPPTLGGKRKISKSKKTTRRKRINRKKSKKSMKKSRK